MKQKKYFAMEKVGNEANVNIYGDITSWAWEELGEMSAVILSKQLEQLTDVERINVYINSYGGEVAEGLAIYNALKRHKAKVVTYCDGFAASIASVIFMAGDERIMNESSLLMIHNAWTFCEGNAEQLRKQADDLEKITQASVIAYKAHSTLSEEEIKDLMDKETWLLPTEALEYGFATDIEKTEKKAASQNAKMRLLDIIKMYRQEADTEDADDGEDEQETPVEDEDKDGGGESTEEEEKPVEEEIDGADDDSEDQNPDDTEDEPTEDEETDEDGDEDEPQAAQKLNGFFNAILKI